MAGIDWTRFLRQWSEDILASKLGEDAPADARAGRWLGLTPATEDQISQAEARLKIALPPSYKSFLRVSNGWLRTTHAIHRLWGVEQLAWFGKHNREWVAAYTDSGPDDTVPDEEYFAYGDFAGQFRSSHLKTALQITEEGDSAVYLLNPQVISKDGEWEAWLFADWLPGAQRYRSFEVLMQAEYQQVSGGEWRQQQGVVGELPDEYLGAPGSAKRRVKKRTRPRPKKILGKPYDQWTAAELLELAKSRDPGIFIQALLGLQLLCDPQTIEPLFAFLPKGGNRATFSMHALRKLAPDRLQETLLDLIRTPTYSALFAAAYHLMQFKETRAVPFLMVVMRGTGPTATRHSPYICKSIAKFGMPGYVALVSALADPDPIVRQRVVEGLFYTHRPEARDAVEPMLEDADEAVREMAKKTLDLLPPRRKPR